jgi:hypothetical protein
LVLQEGVIEGRKIFGNITKYIEMGASSNFGNMFSVIGASLFLPFLPMAPIQVLTNNLLYDFSQTAIPTDNVDEEYIAAPRHWDISNIFKFMVFVGPISSIFDYANAIWDDVTTMIRAVEAADEAEGVAAREHLSAIRAANRPGSSDTVTLAQIAGLTGISGADGSRIASLGDGSAQEFERPCRGATQRRCWPAPTLGGGFPSPEDQAPQSEHTAVE